MKNSSFLKTALKAITYVVSEVALTVMLLSNNNIFATVVGDSNSFINTLNVHPLIVFFLVLEIFLYLPLLAMFFINKFLKWLTLKQFLYTQLVTTLFLAVLTFMLSTLSIG